ncbi:NAD(P)+ transhydrogenase beta chain [Agrobacterium vitis]|uniref:NAD(P)+ transhydrogenase beta chain n=1 Tax=Rhizobium/Agrobacterium group TaxID=227290 RepID=UPI0012E93A35|nr:MULTISPECIES: NAD(P)+ transhydrogenase beta chain [Rhizobium/Agrobacterium group]MCF1492481.1 NAD(P)+ transhydrogenase beta chain [Allorhizobium ampelinum]MVA44473.1 NAD(P)+ transhydrogenase beta chain [Agrobacterium vitis]
MEKPSYTTSKQWLWCSGALAWTVILALTIGACLGSEQAVAFGNVAVPSMVGLIVALLGVHRAFGSLDMRAMTRGAKPDPPCLEPPAGGQS